VTTPEFSLRPARSPPPIFFQAGVPSTFFQPPSRVQKNGDQETLKHRPHKKEDDMAYREEADHPFLRGI
jgi:hypothetical protein